MACPRAEKNDRMSETPYLEQSDDNYTVCSLQEQESSASGRQNLRSQYLAFKDSFTEEEISRSESEEFYSVIIRAERLHKLVSKPQEQLADAEALLQITNTLFSSLKSSHSSEGLQLSDFICCLIQRYGENDEARDCKHISWIGMGLDASFGFRNALRMQTMIGPMDTKPTQRKTVTRRKRVRPPDIYHPEEVEDTACKNEKDTHNNVSVMFDILKRSCIQLEKLVLNRLSFSRTVENIFALTFLVRDGRAEIIVNDSGMHLVSPRNAPTAKAIVSKQVTCHQFVLRFDYMDWELMRESVEKGEEAMPQRARADHAGVQHAVGVRKRSPTI
ncbi:non-structural maintenance of chromosomes element 4 A [Cinnamomum micranthum f. kanehirae]|uniref:Non-structural maintenance of chromosomes element 4 n=1 Tax=Cinnamomum micranthum f. kanehirae TaxID=337451 RepID=A0A3S4N4Q4_9MAGN|nr:non-structural maintenance of chromosomes element 4 A [Cinnamomum micranthum f. kanehirae]